MIQIGRLLGRDKKTEKLYAVADGISLPIEEVKDDVFSKKMMGDGIAIRPTGNIIAAPCDGVLSALFPTGHAFGIRCPDGIEILVHIGLETVSLQGKGFKPYKHQGDRVRCGEKIVEIDLPLLERHGFDPTIILVIVNDNHRDYLKMDYTQVFRKQSVLMSFS